MIRVLLVDDEALVRSGIRMILELQEDIEVVGEAVDGVAAVELARELRPDLVLMDLRMDGGDGVHATAEIVADRQLATRVIVLTTFDMDEYVYLALRAGASGFLLKSMAPELLLRSIRGAAHGEATYAPSVARRLVEHFVDRAPTRASGPSPIDKLTPREREVLRCVARGSTNSEVAAALFVSEPTVRTHLTNLLAKLGLRDRLQAIVFAYESGFVTPGEADATS
jgi:DNA-binding NarL/FixJ family response regulator